MLTHPSVKPQEVGELWQTGDGVSLLLLLLLQLPPPLRTITLGASGQGEHLNADTRTSKSTSCKQSVPKGMPLVHLFI